MEELKLYEGRPADCTGRLEKEIRTYDLLDKLGIQFWRTDHGWMRADTMEDCHVIDACPRSALPASASPRPRIGSSLSTARPAPPPSWGLPTTPKTRCSC